MELGKICKYEPLSDGLIVAPEVNVNRTLAPLELMDVGTGSPSSDHTVVSFRERSEIAAEIMLSLSKEFVVDEKKEETEIDGGKRFEPASEERSLLTLYCTELFGLANKLATALTPALRLLEE